MRKFYLSSCSLLLVVAIYLLALNLLLLQRGLYARLAPERYNSHNLSAATMEANYQQLLRYCLLGSERDLQLQELPLSEAAAQHFREVRQLFALGQKILLLVTLLLLLLYFSGKGERRALFWAALAAILTPLALLLPLYFAFDQLFLSFHQLSFANELWLFDPSQDPIINYLPLELFQRNALLWAALVLSLAFGLVLFYYLSQFCRRRKSGRNPD